MQPRSQGHLRGDGPGNEVEKMFKTIYTYT